MDGFCIDAGLVSSLDELDDDEIRNFAELHQDEANDQAELSIYASCLAFQKGGLVDDLARALVRTQVWIGSMSERGLNSERQTRILDAITDLGLQKKLESIGSTDTENWYVSDTVVTMLGNRIPQIFRLLFWLSPWNSSN